MSRCTAPGCLGGPTILNSVNEKTGTCFPCQRRQSLEEAARVMELARRGEGLTLTQRVLDAMPGTRQELTQALGETGERVQSVLGALKRRGLVIATGRRHSYVYHRAEETA